MARISALYRFYFLWFEPIASLLGGITGFLDPKTIIEGTTPIALIAEASAPVSPMNRMFVSQICSLYLLFAWNQGVVLRVTKDMTVWRTALAGMLLSDVGHIYALYTADPLAFVDVAAWRGTDWINEGTLILGMALRLTFLLGIGVR